MTQSGHRWRGGSNLHKIGHRREPPEGDMKRREFVTLISSAGGTLLFAPLTGWAQQADRIRRIGVLEATNTDDPEIQPRYRTFEEGLKQLGWIPGRNLQIDYRSGGGDAGNMRKQAEALVALAPDVILATGSAGTGQALKATRTVPIVFVIVPDPVGSGFVDSLAQPGGNATGFLQFEYGISGKWLELLKQIALNLTRVLVLWDPALTAGIGQFAIIQSAATSVGVDVKPLNVTDASEIERALTAFARSPNGGLIVTGSALSVVRRHQIIALAAQYKLPAIYPNRLFITSGGLVCYGSDLIDQYRRAAAYVDRILKGEKPADLPVQAPTKYELVINLKTAKAMGLTIPPAVLARATNNRGLAGASRGSQNL
jgi:putative ABC transport system substrate-binding protein